MWKSIKRLMINFLSQPKMAIEIKWEIKYLKQSYILK